MVDTSGTPNGNSQRASGRLGQPGENTQERRLSGRQSKSVQKLPQVEGRALDFEEQVSATEPQQTAQPEIGEDVAALIEAPPPLAAPVAAPAPRPPVKQPPIQRPEAQVPIDDDTRYLIKKDADAVRDSRRMLQPAKRNDRSVLAQSDTDHLPPVNGKHPAWIDAPSARPPSDADYEKDASGSRRIYLVQKRGSLTPQPPVLTLVHKVEAALAGRGQLETDVLSLRHGKTTVRISVDLIKEHRCALVVQHTTAKGLERLALTYRAPRTSNRPGETGIENAFDPSQISEHNAHKDHLTSHAIPDAEANWAHVRKWVQRAADGSLFGRPGVSLVKTIEQIATLVTHRTTLARYLSAVCELSRLELDARQATRLVLAQGLAWNEKQSAPQGLLNAQVQLGDEYDRLIARWNAAYVCAQQLAQQYGLSLANGKKACAPTQAAQAVSSTMTDRMEQRARSA